MPGAQDDAAEDQPTYTAGQVAQKLGIPPATLRAWHRRYGVAPHASRPGGYRRYDADDVMRLERMRDLVQSGALASDAARMITQNGAGIEVLRAQLVEASRRLDNAGCQTIMARALRTFGAVACWELLCRPALRSIEAEQSPGTSSAPCIPQEHVLSRAVSAAIRVYTAGLTTPGPTRVFLVCPDGEHHTLPLEVLAAALAERGETATMLGASVPQHSMVEAARTLSAQVVVVWSQRKETASRESLAGLRRLSLQVLTAGPGWSPRNRAADRHLNTLEDAVETLTAKPSP